MQSLRCSLSILNMSAGNKDGIKILCCPYVCHLLFMQCKGWVLIRAGIGSKGVGVQEALNSAKPQTENNPRGKVSWLRSVQNGRGAAPCSRSSLVCTGLLLAPQPRDGAQSGKSIWDLVVWSGRDTAKRSRLYVRLNIQTFPFRCPVSVL